MFDSIPTLVGIALLAIVATVFLVPPIRRALITAPIFTIPGPAWIAIIGALMAIIRAVFPDQPWAPAIVVVLGIVAKLIQWMIDYKAGKNPSFEIGIVQPATPAPAAQFQTGTGDEEYTYTSSSPAPMPPDPEVLIAPYKEPTARKITRFLFS